MKIVCFMVAVNVVVVTMGKYMHQKLNRKSKLIGCSTLLIMQGKGRRSLE
jgi:hypothetical protein